jgi:hypothetical protein
MLFFLRPPGKHAAQCGATKGNRNMTTENTTSAAIPATGSNVKPPVSLGAYAMNEAIKAAKNDDSAFFKAVCAVSLVIANGQIELIDSDNGIDESKIKATWRAFLYNYAAQGGMVWRDTQHKIDAIRAKKPAERVPAARLYVDKKEKQERLTDSLARIRTFSVKVMEWTLKNHADEIRNIRALRGEIDAKTLAESFETFVKAYIGATGAALQSFFAQPAKAKDETTESQKILAKAKDMTLSDLSDLAKAIDKLLSDRRAVELDIANAFGGESDETGENDSGESSEAERDAELDAQYGEGYAAKLKASTGGPILMESAA